MKRYLFYLGHPAHYHLFKHAIARLKANGNKTDILIKKKDILDALLTRSGIEYLNILPEGRKDNKLSMAWGIIKRDWRLLRHCLAERPDIMIGTSIEIGHIGSLLNIPTINVNEDDHHVVPLYAKLSYPFCSCILSPSVCDNGKWENKTIKYESNQELAYLHPNHFNQSDAIVEKYINPKEKYFIIRFAKLGAHHDSGIKGFTDDLALKVIQILEPHGQVIISSEKKLDSRLEKFQLRFDPLDMHHIMANATLYIGDSQTMAAEAGVLGTPFIRFNDFVGRIGYLNDIENKYGLGFGIKPNNPENLIAKTKELISSPSLKTDFQAKRKRLLQDKIDTSLFLHWFISNYPKSAALMKENPDVQYTLPSLH